METTLDLSKLQHVNIFITPAKYVAMFWEEVIQSLESDKHYSTNKSKIERCYANRREIQLVRVNQWTVLPVGYFLLSIDRLLYVGSEHS